MAYTGVALYAGSSTSLKQADLLPSPTSLSDSREPIWDENAGRNASGDMVATLKAQKRTYEIGWAILSSSEMSSVLDKLTAQPFYFAEGSKGTNPSSPIKCYRSAIAYEVIWAGAKYYKNVSVSVIQW